jgi:hypothetical protein
VLANRTVLLLCRISVEGAMELNHEEFMLWLIQEAWGWCLESRAGLYLSSGSAGAVRLQKACWRLTRLRSRAILD